MEAHTITEKEHGAAADVLRTSSITTNELILARPCEGEVVVMAPMDEKCFSLDLTGYCQEREEKYQAATGKNTLAYTLEDINRQETLVYKDLPVSAESPLKPVSGLPNYYTVPRCSENPGKKFSLLMQEIESEFTGIGAVIPKEMRSYIEEGFHQDGFLQKVYGLFVMEILPKTGYMLDHGYTDRAVKIKIIDKDTIEIEERCAYFGLRDVNNPSTIMLGSVENPICCLTNKLRIKYNPLDKAVSSEFLSAHVTSHLKAEGSLKGLVDVLKANPNDPQQWDMPASVPPVVSAPILPSSSFLSQKTTKAISSIGIPLAMFVLFMALGFSLFSSSTGFGLISGITEFFASPVAIFSVAGFTVAFIAHMVARQWQLSVADTPASQAIVSALGARNILKKWISTETRQNGILSIEEQHVLAYALLTPIMHAKELLRDYPDRALVAYPATSTPATDYEFLCSSANYHQIAENKQRLLEIFERITKATVNPHWITPYPREWKIFWLSLSTLSFIGSAATLSYIFIARATLPAIGWISGLAWSLSLAGLLGFIAWKSMEHLLGKTSGKIGEKFLRALKIILIPGFSFLAFLSVATMFQLEGIGIFSEVTNFFVNTIGIPWPSTFSVTIFAISGTAVFGLVKSLLQVRPTTADEFKKQQKLARRVALFFKIALPVIALSGIIALLIVKNSPFSVSISVLATFLTIALAPLFSMKTPFKNFNAQMRKALSFWSFFLSVRPLVGKWEEVKYLVYAVREVFLLGVLVLLAAMLQSYGALDTASVAACFSAIAATEIYRLLRLSQHDGNPKVLARLYLKNSKEAGIRRGSSSLELAIFSSSASTGSFSSTLDAGLANRKTSNARGSVSQLSTCSNTSVVDSSAGTSTSSSSSSSPDPSPPPSPIIGGSRGVSLELPTFSSNNSTSSFLSALDTNVNSRPNSASAFTSRGSFSSESTCGNTSTVDSSSGTAALTFSSSSALNLSSPPSPHSESRDILFASSLSTDPNSRAGVVLKDPKTLVPTESELPTTGL